MTFLHLEIQKFLMLLQLNGHMVEHQISSATMPFWEQVIQVPLRKLPPRMLLSLTPVSVFIGQLEAVQTQANSTLMYIPNSLNKLVENILPVFIFCTRAL